MNNTLFADQVSKREMPKKINEDIPFKNYDENSKIFDSEDISELETDILVENALLNSELFSTDNSLSFHKGKKQVTTVLRVRFESYITANINIFLFINQQKILLSIRF